MLQLDGLALGLASWPRCSLPSASSRGQQRNPPDLTKKTSSPDAGRELIISQFASLQSEVIGHWEREVRARVDSADTLRRSALTQGMTALYDEVIAAVGDRSNSAQTHDGAISHGVERARNTSFGPDHIVHEYQIFRESMLVVAEGRMEISLGEWRKVDSAIDNAMRSALRAFLGVQEQARRKVAAELSHDMRTPLSVIANGSQLISVTPSLDIAKSSASKIQRNAQRLTEMIGELVNALTFQGDATISLHPTHFDAMDLLREVCDQYAQANSASEFEAEGDRVSGHRCREALRRVLENLVNNALKYGDGGLVKMAVRQNRNRLILSVNNAGAPIAQEQRERIFDYLRRDNNVSAVPGWGIGLQFVKAVAEAHGGDVSIDSSLDRGTTFFLQLPLDSRPFIDEAGGQV